MEFVFVRDDEAYKESQSHISTLQYTLCLIMNTPVPTPDSTFQTFHILCPISHGLALPHWPGTVGTISGATVRRDPEENHIKWSIGCIIFSQFFAAYSSRNPCNKEDPAQLSLYRFNLDQQTVFPRSPAVGAIQMCWAPHQFGCIKSQRALLWYQGSFLGTKKEKLVINFHKTFIKNLQLKKKQKILLSHLNIWVIKYKTRTYLMSRTLCFGCICVRY